MTQDGTREILRVVYWGMRGRRRTRKIPICREWLNSKEAFIDWSIENGYRRGLHIDRKNGTKGYSPLNCRYVTRLVNARNLVNGVTDFENRNRRCRQCKVIKKLNDFYRSKGHALDRTYLCKPCKRIENKVSYYLNKKNKR